MSLSLTQLPPESIRKHFPVIRWAVVNSVTPQFNGDTESSMGPILEDMLAGRLQVWVLHDDEHDICIAVTEIIPNGYNGKLALNVFAMYSIRDMTPDEFDYCVEAMKIQAEANHCSRIAFHTGLPKMAKIFKEKYGATVQQFVILEAHNGKF